MVVEKKEIWLTILEPTIGSEINKTRPCIIVSPDVANKYKDSVIIVPLTSTKRNFPSRVDYNFKNKEGQIVVDQIRAIDKSRLVKKIGIIDDHTSNKVYEIIKLYFK